MKTFGYILICAAVFATVSCNEKKTVMTPEEVVEAFSRAVASGDFSTARSLCDTVSMNAYLENYMEVMNSLQKEDSCVLAIAAGLLAGAEFEVVNIEKDGNERTVEYKLAAEGNEKAKKATLKKEEGGWKVTSITDAK